MEKGETENLLLCETPPPEKLFSGFEWRMSEPRYSLSSLSHWLRILSRSGKCRGARWRRGFRPELPYATM